MLRCTARTSRATRAGRALRLPGAPSRVRVHAFPIDAFAAMSRPLHRSLGHDRTPLAEPRRTLASQGRAYRVVVVPLNPTKPTKAHDAPGGPCQGTTKGEIIRRHHTPLRPRALGPDATTAMPHQATACRHKSFNTSVETSHRLYKTECTRAAYPALFRTFRRLSDLEEAAAEWIQRYNLGRLISPPRVTPSSRN